MQAGVCWKAERRCTDLWMLPNGGENIIDQVWEAGGFSRGVASPCHFFHEGLQTNFLVHGDDFLTVDTDVRRESMHIFHKVPEVVTVSDNQFLGWSTDIATVENRVRARPAARMGLTTARCVATPGSDDAAPRPVRSASYEERQNGVFLLKKSKRRVTFSLEELKLFRSVAVRLNFHAMDRTDLF